MITLNKHTISASIEDRYANITYSFDFENTKEHSGELKFELTIDPKAFISKFEACIDGELFIGKTKEKATAAKEYTVAKEKNENAILISQPHKNIPNVFGIKTNIDAKSTVLLIVKIEQYLQKTFGFNELNIQLLRNWNKYNITQNFNHIAFQLIIEDSSGIHDIHVPMMHNDDINMDQQMMNKNNTKCEINGTIMNTDPSTDTVHMDNEWRHKLSVNDTIDVKDHGQWYNAEIMEKSAVKGIKIHFLGYGAKYDTYIDINSDRLAPFNSRSIQINTNELIFKYKIKGESDESHVLFDNNSNTFCHIISDIITDSMIHEKELKDIAVAEGNNALIRIPRRVMFVIDRSGSMGGSKWLKTIEATIMAIKQLRSGYDRFGIILFDNTIELLPYTETRGCILADNKSIMDSVQSLQSKHVDGGTNINDALLKAIELIKVDILLLNNDTNEMYNFFLNQIIFITDGEANVGESNTKKIITNIQNANDLSKIDKYNHKISIFSFGVGKDGNDSEWIKDLNHSFLKLLSVNNNGFYQRIKQSSADTSLCEYFNIVSKPVLSNINIDYKNTNIKDLTNTRFNALYAGNDLIICGKIENKEKDIKDYDILLTITAITGKEIKQNEKCITKPITIVKEMKINISANSMNDDNTERIWAYLKLQQLATRKLLHTDMIEIDDDEKKEDSSIPLSLALKYKFVTPWTSMIVVKKKDNTPIAQKPFEQWENAVRRSKPTYRSHKSRRSRSSSAMSALSTRYVTRSLCVHTYDDDDESEEDDEGCESDDDTDDDDDDDDDDDESEEEDLLYTGRSVYTSEDLLGDVLGMDLVAPNNNQSNDDDSGCPVSMVFDYIKGNGLQMNVGFERRNGKAVMIIKAHNKSKQAITRIYIKFNKNYLGIQPTETMVFNGTIAPNVSTTVHLPLQLSQEPTVLKKPLDLTVQMAVKKHGDQSKSSVTMFATQIPAELFFENQDNTLRDTSLFLKEWKAIPNREDHVKTLKQCKNTDVDVVKDIFTKNGFSLVRDEQLPNGVRIYFATTLRSVAILLELSIANYNGECRVVVKSKNKYLSYVVCETVINWISS